MQRYSSPGGEALAAYITSTGGSSEGFVSLSVEIPQAIRAKLGRPPDERRVTLRIEQTAVHSRTERANAAAVDR